ncbi:MAG: amidohydrolase family protein [Firmicutes bacterium]|nr:amidohydrolase family protein [Bacillota bacterium]
MARTLLTDGRIIDPAENKIIENGLLTLLHGNHAPDSIGYCGDRDAPEVDGFERSLGKDDFVLSLEGATLLPGLIDVQTELFLSGDKNVPQSTLVAYRRAAEMLSRGITSIGASADRFGIVQTLAESSEKFFLWMPMIVLMGETGYSPAYCLFRGLPEKGSEMEQRWLEQANKACMLGMKPVLSSMNEPVCQQDGSLTLVRMSELLVDGGFSHMEALQALTSNAAEVLGISSRNGRLAKGFEGDIIAVKGNPLEKISDLNNCVMSARGGRLIRSGLSGLKKSNFNLLPPGYDFN